MPTIERRRTRRPEVRADDPYRLVPADPYNAELIDRAAYVHRLVLAENADLIGGWLA